MRTAHRSLTSHAKHTSHAPFPLRSRACLHMEGRDGSLVGRPSSALGRGVICNSHVPSITSTTLPRPDVRSNATLSGPSNQPSAPLQRPMLPPLSQPKPNSHRAGGSPTAAPLDPVQRLVRQSNYKNKWGRKRAADLAPQLTWQSPLRNDPTIAIIGGGLSGLACAENLAAAGVHSVIFDTGEHGPGGRLATRSSADGSLHTAGWATATTIAAGWNGGPQPGAGVPLDSKLRSPAKGAAAGHKNAGLVFDHAAQYFTCTDARFKVLVDQWLASGWVHRWDGPVGDLRQGTFTPIAAGGPTRYVAGGGMRQLAARLAHSLTSAADGNDGTRADSNSSKSNAISAGRGVHGSDETAPPCASGSVGRGPGLVQMRRPMWISKMLSEEGLGWKLMGEGRSQGVFDAVVIAHNGKCANRLVGPTGAPRVAQQLMELRLNAVWALVVAFDGPVPTALEGAFVHGGSGDLAWVANNTAKLKLRHEPSCLQCWTLISSAAYGQRNKVPQEAVPPEVHCKVAVDLLSAFRAALGGVDLPRPVYARAQLWGAALPLNTPSLDCILDPASRVGVCGDWLGGSSMQAAAVSGAALAQQLAALRGVPMKEEALAPFRIGLAAPLRPVPGAKDIGQFPGAAHPGPARSSHATLV